jgi:spore maturation protein A
MSESKLTEKLAKLLMPLTFFLFGEQDKETRELLATNIAANLIGVGSAATPSGIMAAQRMQGQNETINKSTMMLIVLNASSLQIVPTTIITMRQEAGSAAASGIFMPALITSVITSLLAVGLVKLFVRGKKAGEV